MRGGSRTGGRQKQQTKEGSREVAERNERREGIAKKKKEKRQRGRHEWRTEKSNVTS